MGRSLEIETRLDIADVPWTVVAPVFFMDNVLTAPAIAGLRRGVLSLGLPAGRSVPMAAVGDVGKFVVHVLANRERFLGKRIELGSDQLSCESAAEILADALGRPIRVRPAPLAMSSEPLSMYEWFDTVGVAIDIAELHRRYPEIGWHRFHRWVKERDWDRLLGARAN